MKSGSLNYPWRQLPVINICAVLGWHYISRLFSKLIRLEIIKRYYFCVNWGLWPGNLMPSLLHEENARDPRRPMFLRLHSAWVIAIPLAVFGCRVMCEGGLSELLVHTPSTVFRRVASPLQMGKCYWFNQKARSIWAALSPGHIIIDICMLAKEWVLYSGPWESLLFLV